MTILARRTPRRSRAATSLSFAGAACILLVAAGPLLAQRGRGLAPLDLATDPAPRAAEFVDVERGGNIGKIKRVGIINFTVEFALSREVTVVTFQANTVTTTKTKMQVPALDATVLQAIVDELYADVQSDLKGMGMELIPYEELKATKPFQKLDDAMHASPWATSMKDVHSVLLAPSGMSVYLDNVARADYRKSLGFIFGTNTRLAEIRMVNDLKGAHLLSVNIVIDFKKLSEKWSATGFEDALHLVPEGTLYRFVSPTQPLFAVVQLKQPVISTATLWTSVAETQTSSEKTISGRSSSAETRGTFDMAAYVSEARRMFSSTRRMFATEITKQK